MVCACGPCGFLFDNPGAGGGGYRRVPDRYLVDPGFTVTDAQWDALPSPSASRSSCTTRAQDRIIACYPSPAGATESELALDAWRTGIGAGRLRAPSCSPTSRRCSCGAGAPVPARADRRLLPARRPGQAALAGLRRRQRGVGGDRRVLRASCRGLAREL